MLNTLKINHNWYRIKNKMNYTNKTLGTFNPDHLIELKNNVFERLINSA